MDAQPQTEQLKTDRPNFWKVVDRTKPGKLSLFSDTELRDCQNYFSNVQSDPTVPPNELIMAAERLTLIRSELDARHADAKLRKVQRLARWAIALATVSTSCAIAFAVAQFVTKPPGHENSVTDAGLSTVATATVMDMHPAAPESTPTTNATPEVALAPVYVLEASTITPTATATVHRRTKHRIRRQTMTKPESRLSLETFLRSLGRARPTQTPSAVRGR